MIALQFQQRRALRPSSRSRVESKDGRPRSLYPRGYATSVAGLSCRLRDCVHRRPCWSYPRGYASTRATSAATRLRVAEVTGLHIARTVPTWVRGGAAAEMTRRTALPAIERGFPVRRSVTTGRTRAVCRLARPAGLNGSLKNSEEEESAQALGAVASCEQAAMSSTWNAGGGLVTSAQRTPRVLHTGGPGRPCAEPDRIVDDAVLPVVERTPARTHVGIRRAAGTVGSAFVVGGRPRKLAASPSSAAAAARCRSRAACFPRGARPPARCS